MTKYAASARAPIESFVEAYLHSLHPTVPANFAEIGRIASSILHNLTPGVVRSIAVSRTAPASLIMSAIATTTNQLPQQGKPINFSSLPINPTAAGTLRDQLIALGIIPGDNGPRTRTASLTASTSDTATTTSSSTTSLGLFPAMSTTAGPAGLPAAMLDPFAPGTPSLQRIPQPASYTRDQRMLEQYDNYKSQRWNQDKPNILLPPGSTKGQSPIPKPDTQTKITPGMIDRARKGKFTPQSPVPLDPEKFKSDPDAGMTRIRPGYLKSLEPPAKDEAPPAIATPAPNISKPPSASSSSRFKFLSPRSTTPQSPAPDPPAPHSTSAVPVAPQAPVTAVKSMPATPKPAPG